MSIQYVDIVDGQGDKLESTKLVSLENGLYGIDGFFADVDTILECFGALASSVAMHYKPRIFWPWSDTIATAEKQAGYRTLHDPEPSQYNGMEALELW